MDERQRRLIECIRGDYEEKPQTTFDQLVALDKKAKRPALIFALAFGIFASLVLGTGMCFAMKVVFASQDWVMPVGIVIGLLGLGLAAANYFLFKKLEQKGKDKYGETILSLTNELLGE